MRLYNYLKEWGIPNDLEKGWKMHLLITWRKCAFYAHLLTMVVLVIPVIVMALLEYWGGILSPGGLNTLAALNAIFGLAITVCYMIVRQQLDAQVGALRSAAGVKIPGAFALVELGVINWCLLLYRCEADQLFQELVRIPEEKKAEKVEEVLEGLFKLHPNYVLWACREYKFVHPRDFLGDAGWLSRSLADAIGERALELDRSVLTKIHKL